MTDQNPNRAAPAELTELEAATARTAGEVRRHAARVTAARNDLQRAEIELDANQAALAEVSPVDRLRARLGVGLFVYHHRLDQTRRRDSREHAKILAEHIMEQLIETARWLNETAPPFGGYGRLTQDAADMENPGK